MPCVQASLKASQTEKAQSSDGKRLQTWGIRTWTAPCCCSVLLPPVNVRSHESRLARISDAGAGKLSRNWERHGARGMSSLGLLAWYVTHETGSPLHHQGLMRW
jgi:hypothetical protein